MDSLCDTCVVAVKLRLQDLEFKFIPISIGVAFEIQTKSGHQVGCRMDWATYAGGQLGLGSTSHHWIWVILGSANGRSGQAGPNCASPGARLAESRCWAAPLPAAMMAQSVRTGLMNLDTSAWPLIARPQTWHAVQDEDVTAAMQEHNMALTKLNLGYGMKSE